MSASQEFSDVTLAGLPPVAVSSMTFLGYPLSEWIYVVTILYTLVATFTLLKKLWDSHKKDKAEEEKEQNEQQRNNGKCS